MNWKLDTDNPYVWQVEGTPFGIEKIDHAYYVPFRLWNKARLYVGAFQAGKRESVTFSSRQEAMKYVEEAVKEYQNRIIVGA
jgi:hypothetical protein